MAGSEQPALICRVDEGAVSTLTLDRPDALNALSPSLFAELRRHVDELAGREDISCVLVRGAGRSFSAGNDLRALQAGDKPPYWEFQAETLERLEKLPQPVVAVVHGHCYTGALELALACDFIVCADNARFCDTHARWAMVPSWGMTQRLPRRIGAANAKAMMFSSRVIDGAEAVRLGLAAECVPADDFDSHVENLAQAITTASRHSHVATKRMVGMSQELALTAGLAYERRHHPGPGPDMNERLQNFGRQK